jgi:hypothetical protein
LFGQPPLDLFPRHKVILWHAHGCG